MKLAVTAWHLDEASHGQGMAEQGEIAERLGFDSFWLPESHFNGALAIPSPLMLLASVAARTERLRLGSTSYLLPIRHPLLAAEEVAVLDGISGGRVILGVGRGWQSAMYRAFDVPIKEKRQRFAANLQQMIAAWQGEPVAQADGEPVRLAPLPVQKPHPPLWVAAFGPLAIKQAASLGLPYLASPIEGLATLAKNYAQHKQQLAEAGHPPTPLAPVMRTLYITDRPAQQRQVREALAKEAAARLRPTDPVEDWALVGTLQYIKERLSAYQEATGLNYLILRGRIPTLSPQQQITSFERLLSQLAC